GEVLNDFPRFFGTLVMKFSTDSMVNSTRKRMKDMIIQNFDLEPKIDAMMRDVLVFSRWENWARKRVVISSQVEMDHV
nr:hypothetical protein [Tanacetum cinerariifolium]